MFLAIKLIIKTYEGEKMNFMKYKFKIRDCQVQPETLRNEGGINVPIFRATWPTQIFYKPKQVNVSNNLTQIILHIKYNIIKEI